MTARRRALAVLAATLAGAALAGAALLADALAAGAAEAGSTPVTGTAVYEGPGGREALVHWVLRRDPSNRGLALGWARGGFSGSSVQVPNVVRPFPYSGPAGAANYEGSIAWYRTSFDAAATGLYALDFESANYEATVWVDGRMLGSHHGSYLPFELRERLAAGAHTVVVRVDWRDPRRQATEGFHRTWFNWGGIDGEVDVRPVGASDLSEPSLQTTLSPDSAQAPSATVRVSVRVSNEGPARTITPQGSLAQGAERVPLEFGPLQLGHGQSAVAQAIAQVQSPALWSPAHPSLYDLALEVPGESSYHAHVGLRELTWHGGEAYLNGQLLRLHGVSIQQDARGHGDALTPGDEAQLMAELRAVHADVVRCQHPLPAALLERLDAAGMLVWQGVGPVEGAGMWYSTTPRLRAEAEAQARTAVLAEQLHPSVFAWNLVDEVADQGRDAAEVSYVRNLTAWIHRRDPTRMVAVDVWGDHPPRVAGPLYAGVDAVAETDYSGWYDYPSDSPAQLAAAMRARLAAMQRTFAGKVLVISEFGAESNTLNPTNSPGGYAFQARLLEQHIRVYEADPDLTAMMIWVLRDYPLTPTFEGGSIHTVLPQVRLIEGLSQKGLFTYSGAPKPAVAAVARLYAALPAF